MDSTEDIQEDVQENILAPEPAPELVHDEPQQRQPVEMVANYKDLPNNKQLYAELAEVSYKFYNNQDLALSVYDFYIFPDFSDINSVLLINNERKELVLSIRGTKLDNIHDLRADYDILINNLTNNTRYKNILEKAKIIAKSKGNFKFNLTGHSLGGALCIEIAKEIISSVNHIYVYNAGFSIKQAISSIGKQLLKKIGIKNRAIRIEHELKKKLFIYQSGFDPISLLSYSTGEVEYSKPKSSNTHTLNNFIGNGWWCEYL